MRAFVCVVCGRVWACLCVRACVRVLASAFRTVGCDIVEVCANYFVTAKAAEQLLKIAACKQRHTILELVSSVHENSPVVYDTYIQQVMK